MIYGIAQFGAQTQSRMFAAGRWTVVPGDIGSRD